MTPSPHIEHPFGLVAFIIGLLFLYAVFELCRCFPRHRLKGDFQFWVEGVPMSQVTLKPGQTVPAQVSYTAGGQPGQPASPPTWSSDTPSVASVAPAEDGMSAVVSYVGPGAAVITVVAEGDVTPGVDTITLQGTVTCSNPEIDAGEIVFGAPV